MAPTGYNLGLSATALYFLAISKQYFRNNKTVYKPSHLKKIFLNVDLATLVLRSPYQPEIICWYTWVILWSLELIAQLKVFFKRRFLIFGLSNTYFPQKWLALFEFYTEYKNSVMDLSFWPNRILKSWSIFVSQIIGAFLTHIKRCTKIFLIAS